MKIIVEDYGCGTSSSFVDYGLDNVIHCSYDKHDHIFDIVGEDLFFVGHEFLMYLWDTEKKVNHWKNYGGRKIVWCFEKIDCIVPIWQQKSHYSLEICQKFTDEFVASDEEDCRKYGIHWLPQWASRKFFDQREQQPTETRIVFSGQAGVPGYFKRDQLLMGLQGNSNFYVSNATRKLSWDEYVKNFLNHDKILAPFGNLKAFNTRTFEALTSGRLLLQQVDSEYKWHVDLISKHKNVLFFETKEELLSDSFREKINKFNFDAKGKGISEAFEENNFYSRFKKIGL